MDMCKMILRYVQDVCGVLGCRGGGRRQEEGEGWLHGAISPISPRGIMASTTLPRYRSATA